MHRPAAAAARGLASRLLSKAQVAAIRGEGDAMSASLRHQIAVYRRERRELGRGRRGRKGVGPALAASAASAAHLAGTWEGGVRAVTAFWDSGIAAPPSVYHSLLAGCLARAEWDNARAAYSMMREADRTRLTWPLVVAASHAAAHQGDLHGILEVMRSAAAENLLDSTRGWELLQMQAPLGVACTYHSGRVPTGVHFDAAEQLLRLMRSQLRKRASTGVRQGQGNTGEGPKRHRRWRQLQPPPPAAHGVTASFVVDSRELLTQLALALPASPYATSLLQRLSEAPSESPHVTQLGPVRSGRRRLLRRRREGGGGGKAR